MTDPPRSLHLTKVVLHGMVCYDLSLQRRKWAQQYQNMVKGLSSEKVYTSGRGSGQDRKQGNVQQSCDEIT